MALENAPSVSVLFPFVSEVSEYNRIDISAREREREREKGRNRGTTFGGVQLFLST